MSSTKKLIVPFRLIDAGDISGSITGSQVNCAHQDGGIAYIAWTGTSPIGEVQFEFLELDAAHNTAKTDEWKQVDFGSTISVSGNTGSHQIVFTSLPFFALRPKYVRTSGIGSLSVTFAAKEG